MSIHLRLFACSVVLFVMVFFSYWTLCVLLLLALLSYFFFVLHCLKWFLLLLGSDGLFFFSLFIFFLDSVLLSVYRWQAERVYRMCSKNCSAYVYLKQCISWIHIASLVHAKWIYIVPHFMASGLVFNRIFLLCVWFFVVVVLFSTKIQFRARDTKSTEAECMPRKSHTLLLYGAWLQSAS